MGFLSKLFKIGSNVVVEQGNKTVDSLVDIRREGNGIIRKLDGNIKSLEKRLEDAQVMVSMSKLNIAENAKRIASMNAVAEESVKVGNDMDALNALSLIEGMEATDSSNQSTIDTLEPIIHEQLGNLNILKTERIQLQNEIIRLDIEEKAYKAKLELLGGNAGEMAFNIDDLRERVQLAKAKVDAKAVINENTVDSLEKKYDVKPQHISAKARLVALKEKMEEAK